MKPVSLTFKAGESALQSIRSHGFDPASIGTVVGASGGAKWLVLSQLDRAIIEVIQPRLAAPVHLLGSSIGAWRFACYAQRDPAAAIRRFEDAYIEQSFSKSPDIAEITKKSREIIAVVLGENGIQEVLQNSLFRSHIMAVRSRHLLGSEQRWLLATGLAVAAGLNVISRRTLGMFFERALFSDPRDKAPFSDLAGFGLNRVVLDAGNYEDAVVATGSIPLVLSGVHGISGAPAGVYRDGGIIDYHHDVPHSDTDRLTLYPHFHERIIPGWFDKRLHWRRPDPGNVARTILVCPSRKFVAGLPNGKIPDRTDFVTYDADERKAIWRACIEACQQMADEFREVIEKQQLAAHLQAL